MKYECASQGSGRICPSRKKKELCTLRVWLSLAQPNKGSPASRLRLFFNFILVNPVSFFLCEWADMDGVKASVAVAKALHYGVEVGKRNRICRTSSGRRAREVSSGDTRARRGRGGGGEARGNGEGGGELKASDASRTAVCSTSRNVNCEGER